MSKIQYFPPMFERLTPRTPWAGGRMVDTDVLTLAEAASMATKHAGEPVTIGDFLRAAGRGEITLRAIVHTAAKVQKHDGGIYCNGGQENENRVPAGAIATLPLTACQHLAAAGRASWRTFDGFEMVDGVLQRYTKGELVAGEPDFETVTDDCRVMGYDVRALADEYTAPEATQAEPQAAPVVNTKAKPRTWWEISSAYIVEVMQAGQYATAKELYRALEAKAGPNAPFDKGTGASRGSLFVREIAQPLSLKTVQNNWPALRELAKK
jgi:hypothetical protein